MTLLGIYCCDINQAESFHNSYEYIVDFSL